MSQQPTSLPDRLIALLRAKDDASEEAASLQETDHEAWVQFVMMAEAQLDSVVDAMRHAHDGLYRLRMLAKHAKQK